MNRNLILKTTVLTIVLAMTLLSGCQSKQRQGMVRDQKTGLLYGSTVSGNLLMDPSQFANPTIKLTIRNTSGDPAINMKAMRTTLENAYRDKGYKITRQGKYSVHLDINLYYSGQISYDVAEEVSLLGGAGGAYLGGRMGQSTDTAIIGAASGAAIGAIVGQYATQDTYTMLADVSIGLVDRNAGKRKYVIEFGDTQIVRDDEDTGYNAYRVRAGTRVAVYAGGDGISQSKIIRGVTLRFRRILQDII
ncbi:complement resistance protein TraT [Maridesulfovibrio hydrothermalis]|uniref:TraT complement resistance protein n=1 Tax=Maridesulfovibrio hydrothermalis AM13 = DSM 14728 TaxID=1121451 RepID=L0R6R5_9BACT|nr:complement resistance protein TraT [Maridesulfovibrio hydrothermalis]CCO22399.1 conserved exported protein of unknown function [Maridesulfovibrio hydrothermalis AM13 = DSM 14728]